MIKVTDDTKNAYKSDSREKSLEIRIPSSNITLTNEDIVSQSISLNESIETSNNLSFQGCIASCLKFSCADIIEDLEGKYIEADVVAKDDQGQDTETIPLFRGYIHDQSNTSHEQNTMQITAYDALKTINERDVTTWYNNLGTTFTIKGMRDSFFNMLGIQQVEDYLPNDGITVRKTLTDKTIKGSKIIKAICQINGRFGRISRTGQFEYVHLVEGTEALYPREDLYPADDIYPADENAVDSINKAHYISVSFENYNVAPINKVSLVGKDGTIVSNAGSGSNVFYLKDNFLLWELTSSVLSSVARNLYNSIQGLWYTPASVKCPGLPYIECGDFILLATKRSIVRAYVLSRTLTGAQALRDNFDAKGDKNQPKYTPTVQTQITANTQAIQTETSNRVAAISAEASARSSAISAEASARASGDNANAQAIQAETIRAQTIEAQKASIQDLYATNATVGNLSAQVANVNNLVAQKANISDLNATNANISNLYAQVANVGNLVATKVDANYVATHTLTAQQVRNMFESANTIRVSNLYVGGESAPWCQVSIFNGSQWHTYNFLGKRIQ